MVPKIFYFFAGLLLLFSCKEVVQERYASSEIFQLAPPRIQVDSLLFSKSALVSAQFDMQDAVIRYTHDGNEVTESSILYTEPIVIMEATKFAFAAFHPEYQKSPEIHTRLTRIKQSVSNAKVALSVEPHPNYPGGGGAALVDLQKGTTQFRVGKQWLGFQDKQINVQFDFEQEISISKLIISSLNDHGSWIFVPEAIRVTSNNKELGKVSIPIPKRVEPKQIALLDIPIINGSYKNIEIQIDLLEAIPEWHQGKGTTPFFFIDEVLVE